MAKNEKIEIEGLDKLLKKRLKDNKWMADAINMAMAKSAAALQAEAIILAPVNTGALRQSITTEVDKRPPFASWATVGPTVAYGRWVEYGRKPGKMPPVDALEPWVRLKLKAKNPRRVAFAIAMKIAREGIKAQPFLGPAWKKAKPKIETIMKKVRRELLTDWGKKI